MPGDACTKVGCSIPIVTRNDFDCVHELASKSLVLDSERSRFVVSPGIRWRAITERSASFKFWCPWMLSLSLMHFSHLCVGFLTVRKYRKNYPKLGKITVHLCWKTHQHVKFSPIFCTKRWITLERNKINTKNYWKKGCWSFSLKMIRVARFRLHLCQFPRDYVLLPAKAEISAAEEPSVTAWPCARTTSGVSAARASGPPKRPVRFSWERPRQARDNNFIVYTCQRMTLTSTRDCPSNDDMSPS